MATPEVRSVLESVADDDVQQSLASLHEPAFAAQSATVAYEPDARQRRMASAAAAKKWPSSNWRIGSNPAPLESWPGDGSMTNERRAEKR